MAKTIHLNKNGLPYCGTKGKSPEVIGDADTGFYPYEVTCKRCRKKAEKDGIKFVSPQSDQNRTKSDQSRTRKTSPSKKGHEFKILDMSKYDSDPKWISIKDQLPPESLDKIVTVDCLYESVNNDLAIVALQHIHDDIRVLKFSRVSHWKYRE